MRPDLSRRRLCAALAGTGSSLLLVATARAACPVTVVPQGAPVAWSDAAHAASERAASSGSIDCASVEVAVRPEGGATLTFVTVDHRRAVRSILSPDEVTATVDALLVTLPEPEPPPPAPVTAPVAPATATTAPLAPPTPVHFLIGVTSGVRVGLSGAFLAPTVSVRPSGIFGAWEVGALAEIDPVYAYLPGGAPSGFSLSAYIVGVQVGRRASVGGVELGYGAGFGVADVHAGFNDTAGVGRSVDFGQPRASVSARVALPRDARVRFVLELGADAALSNFKKNASVRNDFPELPRWGLLASLGAELAAL
jgi:hypothetical protein